MPKLITLDDGSVRWDYDMPDEPKTAARKTRKTAAPAPVVTDEKQES